MGIGMGMSSCHDFCNCVESNVRLQPSNNPDPRSFTILDKKQYDHAYVLKVKYFGCTNYEGVKVMVFMGKYRKVHSFDPHFSETDISPIARFKPDENGWKLALGLAQYLSNTISQKSKTNIVNDNQGTIIQWRVDHSVIQRYSNNMFNKERFL